MEHIQKFFIVVRSSALKAFQVFLVHEDDVFAGEGDIFAGERGQGHASKGLIDRCFEQGKVVQLTPTTPSATLEDAGERSGLIPDVYRIFDMDILKVKIDERSNERDILFSTKGAVMDFESDRCSWTCMITI